MLLVLLYTCGHKYRKEKYHFPILYKKWTETFKLVDREQQL